MSGKREGVFSPLGPNKFVKNPLVSSSEEDSDEAKPSREKVLEKMQKAAPFCFFLSRIKDVRETYNEDLSITFPELLCLSEPGELEHSVHFTMSLDEAWLAAQYAAAGIENPKIDVYYEIIDPVSNDVALNANLFYVKPKVEFGHHHTKMSLMFYKDGSARVVVCTGNLIKSNWENETQGVWVSPLLPKMRTTQGDSITNFKTDLLNYLKFYQRESLDPWIERLQQVDMSSVMVCFVASVPSGPKTHLGNEYGYRKLHKLLEDHVENRNPDWQIIAQCSSIGRLGDSSEAWLRGEFGPALSPNSVELPPFSLIYPSRSNVDSSLGGILDCQCLRYAYKTHRYQDKTIKRYLQQWKSDGRHRTAAMPHIKTYAQVSPDGKKAGWFLLTSANLSKAAWGKKNKLRKDGSRKLQIWCYEVGVLFLPKFLIGKSEFVVRCDEETSNEDFPFPYDLPLTPYTPTDEPFLYSGYMSQ